MLKKVWETVLDTPIMVVTIGIILGGTVGAAALATFGGVPVTLVSAPPLSHPLAPPLLPSVMPLPLSPALERESHLAYTPSISRSSCRCEIRCMASPRLKTRPAP